MGELQIKRPFTLPPRPLPPLSSSGDDPPSPVSSSRVESLPAPANPLSSFDRSRVIGIIRRKALIKDLAAVYQAECLTYCRELLGLQSNVDEPYTDTTDIKTPLDSRKGKMRPPKRMKKSFNVKKKRVKSPI
ncbi:Hypothetical predicted protein [Olea europaea subsp. europaea]|uniref:Uncharacterized protein n=1 Tax=Olea europaea subsp. europaea TaxID=158383 RepID=A0A8S0V579_OLEEU|nr:Hypothetical predicted protein [Olea europaea subsp. europaea]